MELRSATTDDAEAIRRIYNVEVLESTSTFDLVPRTLEDQVDYITARSGGLAVLVAEDETREAAPIVAWGALSFYRDRPGYRTSVENSIYVARGHHGAGIGDLLLGGLVEQAADHGFHSVFARIVDVQPASMALHRKHGYELVGIEREVGRKFGRWLDVALMQRLL